MANEHHQGTRQSSPFNTAALDARKVLLLGRRRRYYIAAVTLLSLSSILGLVTITVNIVSSTLEKITMPYLILYYVISGLIIAGGITAVVILFFYNRASADSRNFSCFTIFLPMVSSTAAIVGCLLSTYNAAITFGKIITDIFIINAGQAAVFVTSAITALLGIVMTGLLWSVVAKIDAITSAVAQPVENTRVPANSSTNPSTNPPTCATTSVAVNPITGTPVNTTANPPANSSMNPSVNRTMNVPINPSNLPTNPPAYAESTSIENSTANASASVVVNQSILATQVNAISPSHGQPSAPASAPSDLPSYTQIA